MNRILTVFLSVPFLAAVSFAQGQQQQEQPYPFRALDPRQFDARVGPDIDMFVNQWSHEANVEEIWIGTDGETKPLQ
jgi:hypothetical protein